MSSATMPANRLFTFAGVAAGTWRVDAVRPIVGESLPQVNFVNMLGETVPTPTTAVWLLRGIVSNERYVTRAEKTELVNKQQGLGRADSTRAALIPIRKSPAWWGLTQDERRAVLEEQSQHIKIGLKYLPAIARRLHHCRDLGPGEPFDFLTWFEFAPQDAPAFDELAAALRESPEWKFIDREVDIRLSRDAA